MLNPASSKSHMPYTCLELSLCALLLLAVLFPHMLWAQDIAQVKKGVVKITAQVDGKNRVGSGVVVRLDKGHVYIVTASHVIEGDHFTGQCREDGDSANATCRRVVLTNWEGVPWFAL